MGPMHHYYYVYLDKIIPKVNLKTVFQKILCDQLFASPATILCFFYGMGILESKSFSDSTAEISQKFKYVYTVSNLLTPNYYFFAVYVAQTFFFCFRVIVYTGLQYNLLTSTIYLPSTGYFTSMQLL